MSTAESDTAVDSGVISPAPAQVEAASPTDVPATDETATDPPASAPEAEVAPLEGVPTHRRRQHQHRTLPPVGAGTGVPNRSRGALAKVMAEHRGPPSASVSKEKKRQRLEAAFKDYFVFEELISRIPPHRVLAINRGERVPDPSREDGCRT